MNATNRANPQSNAADPRLEVDLAGLKLRNPVLTASGTCGYGAEYAPVLDYSRIGGFTTKSVTLRERIGNEPQRIVEVRSGILNSIGLANVGLERFIAEKAPFIRQMDTRVFVNVAGHSVQDYVAVAESLDAIDCIAGLELNVSCPNVADGLMFGTDPLRLRGLVESVRRVVRRAKLIVKLSPNVTDTAVMAQAAVDGGAQILSLINTYVGLCIDIDKRRPRLANGPGGLSGPAIRPLAVYHVHHVYRQIARRAGVPIIGMGGIQTCQDAAEFLVAGATAVAVGTHLFIDPTSPVKIAEGLSAWLDRQRISRITDVIGTLVMPGDNPALATEG